MTRLWPALLWLATIVGRVAVLATVVGLGYGSQMLYTNYEQAQAQAEYVIVSVLRVVDGDTFDVQLDGQRERLRLIGMDTPETVDRSQPVGCYGPEASAQAKHLLEGQWVAVGTDASQGMRDRYGRLLAYVWLPDGRNYAEVMIGEGYAREYTFRRKYAYSDQFKAVQQAAREEQLGLWNLSVCPR